VVRCNQTSLDAAPDFQTGGSLVVVGGYSSRFDVRFDSHKFFFSCSKFMFDDERRAIGFDDSARRLSPGKAGMDGRIYHRRELFLRTAEIEKAGLSDPALLCNWLA
jgi:hypothetical protein